MYLYRFVIYLSHFELCQPVSDEGDLFRKPFPPTVSNAKLFRQ